MLDHPLPALCTASNIQMLWREREREREKMGSINPEFWFSLCRLDFLFVYPFCASTCTVYYLWFCILLSTDMFISVINLAARYVGW